LIRSWSRKYHSDGAESKISGRFCVFVRKGTWRATENGNCNGNFFLSTKGREGPRRTATATATPFVHGGPRRTATATATPFVHEGPRRTAKNGNCNGNTFCPRRATENGNCNGIFFFVHEGPRRTATATSFCPRGTRRGRGTSWLLLGRGGAVGDGGGDWCGRVRPGFGGGRCGGAAPAQGRAEGPTAQNCSGRWLVVGGRGRREEGARGG